jgi:hypothetical protein
MSINLYLIKGVMFGFEMVETEDYERFVVFDLGILRIYIEY